MTANLGGYVTNITVVQEYAALAALALAFVACCRIECRCLERMRLEKALRMGLSLFENKKLQNVEMGLELLLGAALGCAVSFFKAFWPFIFIQCLVAGYWLCRTVEVQSAQRHP